MADVWCFAVVNRGGTLIRGRNVDRITRIDAGIYDVRFTVSMANAVEVASNADNEIHVWATAYGGVTDSNTVRVVTGIWEFDGSGNSAWVTADAAFQLLVLAQE